VRSVSKRLVVFAGLLAVPGTTGVGHRAVIEFKPETTDPRLVRLQQFLAERDCPITKYAADFIEAADANDLDWRLLPSISLVESGGGKEYMNNNVFGWDSCRQRFPSVRAGIHIVASRLAASDLYRDKNLDGKLRTYNPRVEYLSLVKSVMRSIAPTERAILN
jgi:hypothetical protein